MAQSSPGRYKHLAPTNAMGALITTGFLAITALGLFLSALPQWWCWAIGQGVLAVALVQWFVLIHEAGHNTLFRTKSLNTLAGHLASIFCAIPFYPWRSIHALHHKWTGWQDLDPTTSSLVPRALKPTERLIIDTCWRAWIPLFSVLYRTNNYWNVPRLLKILPRPHHRRRNVLNVAALTALYLGLFVGFGPLVMLKLCGVAVLLSLIFCDPILFSQHNHIPQKLSMGQQVKPHAPIDQGIFTRSLRFPPLISACVLLHFDAHELHHRYPNVPGYWLRKIDEPVEHEYPWLAWILKARRIPASVIMFQNRAQSGLDL